MTILLSICIPTHNRQKLLEECLASVLPQAEKRKNEVEVIVIDNASVDDTEDMVEKKTAEFSCLKYLRNPANLGYGGNQRRCLEVCTGKYMALLCDDDLYIDGEVDDILKVVESKEYAFVGLNYYGFRKDKNKPIKKIFAPEKDVYFERAYEIMNYPSVGHYSGFILNSRLARQYLSIVPTPKHYKTLGVNRGIIGDVATHLTLSTTLPSYFIGKRKLAARMPEKVDYDNLYHQCIDYYNYYHILFIRGLIKKSDLEYRKKLVLGILPRAIISDGPRLSGKELNDVASTLSEWFKGNKKFDYVCFPLLVLMKFNIFKILAKMAKNIYRSIKSIKNKLYF
jgi:glycosyltransferase involved in cell wall biosynthesis